MARRYELACGHCGHQTEFPDACLFGLQPGGDAQLLAEPGRDALRLCGATVDQLRADGRLRGGLPAICLQCGELDAQRSDQHRHWQCAGCGSDAIHQLGVGLGAMRLAGSAILTLLVVLAPLGAGLAFVVPGLLAVGGYWSAFRQLERHDAARLASAPCPHCGQRGLQERPVPARTATGVTSRP